MAKDKDIKDIKKKKKGALKGKKAETNAGCCYVVDPCGYYVDPCGCYADACCC